MTTAEVLAAATEHLKTFSSHVFDVLSVAKPVSPATAINLSTIIHPEIEAFKSCIMNTSFNGMTIREWSKLLSGGNANALKKGLKRHLGITETKADKLLRWRALGR